MPVGYDTSALAAGLALGSTYLLSIGPNKMMIIREALVRGRTGLVASTVLAGYLTLLALCYLMTDVLLHQDPALRTVLSWLGVFTMSWFAFKAVRASLRPGHRVASVRDRREPVLACLRRVARIALVNPLMYLECFFIPAAVCGTFKTLSLRFDFLCGLATMATVACYGYALGGRACTWLFRHPRSLQVFDFMCGLLLASMASSLGARLWFQPL